MQKRYAVIPLTICIVALSIFISSAQPPKIDPELQKEFLLQKSKHYQQLYTIDQQKTENQEDYDVTYYSLDLTPDPQTSILTGQVEVVATVLAQSLNQIDLNFWDGMTISDIHRKDSPDQQLSYTRINDILTIDLDSTHAQGEEFRVVIAYNGEPQNSIYNSFRFDSYDGEHLMWSFSEPYGARAWWPCKDVPSDKADSVDIRVTVPNKFVVASNGTLREKTTEGNLTTHWWHEQYPITTYLVSVAIYPYTVYYDDYLYNDEADTMKIHFYVFPDNYDLYFELNERVNDMIWVFSQIFGEYPFIEEKYGHADCLLGGAMEHQTCTSFGFWTEWLYAHELAHQWWGDLITCDSWHHIWLNEGLASYSEAIWFEVLYPEYPANQYLMDNRHYLGGGTVYVEDPLTEPIFDGNLSYNKGAWVIHMLRYVMGDSITGDVLRAYAAAPEHRYGTATTEEFQAICEQISGMNLDKFFHQWIYEEFYPHYAYGWKLKQDDGGYRIKLGIDQIQENTVLYWMPVDVRIATASFDTTFVIWDSVQSLTVEYFLEEKPLNVEIDPDNWILKETEIMMLAPHAENVKVNNLYQAPGKDTVTIICETNNPDQEILELEAMIESTDQQVNETVIMYDDGLHGDSLAEDGKFGARWPVNPGERSYTVHVKTISKESEFYNILSDAAYFTTTGPVRLTTFEIVSDDTIANPDDRLYIEFTLENFGVTDSVHNISAKTYSLDSCARIVAFSDPTFGDLAPGESAVASRPITIIFNEDCPAPGTVSFLLEIYSDERLLWSDTFSMNVVSDIWEQGTNLPRRFALQQNFPNPFNPTTIINYELPITNYVELNIYNVIGQKVATLVLQQKNAGYHQVEWDAVGFASGVYYYRMSTSSGFVQARKLVLIR
jgi:hypothetical protein